MSHEATAWAWKQELPPTAKLLLIHLSDGYTADEKAVCWNTQYEPQAARFCGIPIEQLYRHLLILEKAEYIVWDRDTGDVDLCIPKDMRSHNSENSLPPIPVSSQLRNRVLIRDRLRCRYCGEEVEPNGAHIDHVLPRSKGGLNTYTNLVTSCPACNLHKGPRTPEEAGMHLTLLSYAGEVHECRTD